MNRSALDRDAGGHGQERFFLPFSRRARGTPGEAGSGRAAGLLGYRDRESEPRAACPNPFRRSRPGCGRRGLPPLSTAFVRNVAQTGRYCDGDGLYLDVQPSGTRSWVQRLVIRGRRRELGLGGFPLVPLKEARAGGDPLAEKCRLKSMPTFAAAAEAVLEQMRPGWRNPKHGKDWLSSMTRFAFPRLGKLPVSEVTSADVVETLRKVWHERPATARRVRQRISTVMEWAVALDYRDDNPCSRIGPVLGPQQDLVQHMRALPHRDVAAVVETVRTSGAAPAVTLAFEFLVLTAARSGEVRGARWAEIDTADHVWTVPATRTKAPRGECPRRVRGRRRRERTGYVDRRRWALRLPGRRRWNRNRFEVRTDDDQRRMARPLGFVGIADRTAAAGESRGAVVRHGDPSERGRWHGVGDGRSIIRSTRRPPRIE